MRRVLPILLLLSTLALPSAAEARGGSIGRIRSNKTFGIGVGSGTFAHGLSFKSFQGDTALQFNLGTFGGHGVDRYGHYHGGIAGSIDVLAEMPALARSDVLRVGWNMGLGAGVGVSGDTSELGIAGAFILGLEFELQPVPVDFVLEWRPQVGLFADDYYTGVAIAPVDVTGHVRVYLF